MRVWEPLTGLVSSCVVYALTRHRCAVLVRRVDHPGLPAARQSHRCHECAAVSKRAACLSCSAHCTAHHCILACNDTTHNTKSRHSSTTQAIRVGTSPLTLQPTSRDGGRSRGGRLGPGTGGLVPPTCWSFLSLRMSGPLALRLARPCFLPTAVTPATVLTYIFKKMPNVPLG